MKNYDAAFRFRFVEGTSELLPGDRFRGSEKEFAFRSRKARDEAFRQRREAFIAEAWDRRCTVRHKGGRFLWYDDPEAGVFRYIRPCDASLPGREDRTDQTMELYLEKMAVEDRETILIQDGVMTISRERKAGPDDPTVEGGMEQSGNIRNPENPLRRVRRFRADRKDVDPEVGLPLVDGYDIYPDELIPLFGEWSLRPGCAADLYPAVRDGAVKGFSSCSLLVDGDYVEELAEEIHRDHRWQNHLDCEHPLETRLRLELNYLFGKERGTIPSEVTMDEFVDVWELRGSPNGTDDGSDAFHYVTSVRLDYACMGDSPWGRIPSLLVVEFRSDPAAGIVREDGAAPFEEMRLRDAYAEVCDYLAGDWQGIRGSREDVFPDGWDDGELYDPSWEDDFTEGLEDDDPGDPFDDDLPEEGTPLWAVMEANGILKTEQRARYERYDASNPGCSQDNPIIITETEDYVGLEYDVLEKILRPVPYRFVDWRVIRQRLMFEGDRAMDELEVEVSTHPFAAWEDGDILMPESEILGTETYWFDITSGFIALGERLGQSPG